MQSSFNLFHGTNFLLSKVYLFWKRVSAGNDTMLSHAPGNKHPQIHCHEGSYKDAIATMAKNSHTSLPASAWKSPIGRTLLLGATDPHSQLSRLGWMLTPLVLEPLHRECTKYDVLDVVKDVKLLNVLQLMCMYLPRLVHQKHEGGKYALHVACEADNHQAVAMLLEAGVDPSTKGSVSSFSRMEYPLHAAARAGSADAIAALVKAGAAVDSMTTCTPLHIAALRGHPEAVKALLQAGANRQAENQSGKTAVQLCRTDEMRKLLCGPSAKPSKQQRCFCTEMSKIHSEYDTLISKSVCEQVKPRCAMPKGQPEEDENAPPPISWTENVDKAKLSNRMDATVPWLPFCTMLRSREQRTVFVPNPDPKKAPDGTEEVVNLADYIMTNLKEVTDPTQEAQLKAKDARQSTGTELPTVLSQLTTAGGNLTLLEPESLVQEALESGNVKGAEPPKPGSINEAVIESGAEGVTSAMKAALVQQSIIKDMEDDLAAAEADPDAAKSAGRSYVFAGWPSSAEDLQLLSDRNVWMRGAFELHNPAEYVDLSQMKPPADGEAAAEPSAAPEPVGEDPLLTGVRETASSMAAGALDSVYTDFVWLNMDVPSAPPPPPEDAEPADPEAEPVPTPDQIAAQGLQQRAGQLQEDVRAFRDMLAARPMHPIPDLVASYDSSFYTQVLDSVPSAETSVSLMLDVMFEQVAINTLDEGQKAVQLASVRREQLEQMMQTECDIGAGLISANSAASITLLRTGDLSGSGESKAALKKTIEASKKRQAVLQLLPGTKLPGLVPLKRVTEEEKGSGRGELYDATQELELAAPAIERTLLQTQMAHMLELPADALLSRTVSEFFAPTAMAEVLAVSTALDAKPYVAHYPAQDVCLIGLSNKTPPERITERKANSTMPLRPRCAQWLVQALDGAAKGIDPLASCSAPPVPQAVVASRTMVEPKVGSSMRLLYPADGSVVHTEGVNGDCTMFSEQLVCGMRLLPEGQQSELVNSLFFTSFCDGSKLAAVADEQNGGGKLQLTEPSGRTVMVTSLGHVHQVCAGMAAADKPKQRVVLGDGTVALQLADDSWQLLFANGNVATRSAAGDWLSCNNLGHRMSVNPAGQELYVPPITVTESLDAITQAHVLTRGDGTLIVTHKDNSKMIHHAGGIVMTTSPSGETVTVEAEGYAKVIVKPFEVEMQVELPDSGMVFSSTATSACLKKKSGEIVLCQISLDFAAKLVTVYPTANTPTPHEFDITIGAYSMVDSEGNSFRSAHNELGAAVDLFVDPATTAAELEADQAAVVAERVMVIGPRGCGKTTACNYLTERYGHEVIDVDNLVKEALAVEEPDEGWPDEGCPEQDLQALLEDPNGFDIDSAEATRLRALLLDRKIKQVEAGHRWVVDGFPATQAQADALSELNVTADRILLLSCSADECANRQCEKDISEEETQRVHAHFMSNRANLLERYRGKCDQINAEEWHEPGRPLQRLTHMLTGAKLAIRPDNFPGIRVRVALSGLPGAGCTVQAKELCSAYGCHRLNVDDLAVASGQDPAALAPAAAAQLIKDAIDSESCRLYGFVVDGWPRNVAQLEASKSAGIEFQKLLLLAELDDEEASRRLTADAGGGEANESLCKAKIEAYNEGKEDLVQFFEGNESELVIIDAGTPPADAAEDVKKATIADVAARVDVSVTAALKEESVKHLPRILLLGPPGAGKTTQCIKLCQEADCVHVAVQDVLKESAEVQALYAQGSTWRTIPDEIVVPLVLARLKKEDCTTKGWVLDGFPRNGGQAEAMREAGVVPKQVVLLSVEEDAAITRVLGRREDPTAGSIFHIEQNMPASVDLYEQMQCAVDETEEVMREQLEGFQEGLEELKELFEASGKMSTVDGGHQISETLEKLRLAMFPQEAPDINSSSTESAPLGRAVQDLGRLRLFAVHSDGSGEELLLQTDVATFLEEKNKDHDTKVIDQLLEEEPSIKSIVTLTKRGSPDLTAHVHATVHAMPRILTAQPKPKRQVLEFRQLLLSAEVSQEQFSQIIEAQKAIEERESTRLSNAHSFTLSKVEKAEKVKLVDTACKAANALRLNLSTAEQAALNQFNSATQATTDALTAAPTEPAVAACQAKSSTAHIRPRSRAKRPAYSTRRGCLLQSASYTKYFESEEMANVKNLATTIDPASIGMQDRTSVPPITHNTQPQAAQASAGNAAASPAVPGNAATPQPAHFGTGNQGGNVLHEMGYEGRNVGLNPPLNVYGEERTQPVEVPSTLLLRPGKEQNTNYKEIEEPVRRPMRTGAALNLTLSGVGVEGRDPSRGFLLSHESIDFGQLAVGETRQVVLSLCNGGIDANRFSVKKPKKWCELQYKTGMVAAGMTVKITLSFCCTEVGEVAQELRIESESDMFTVPITASIVEANSSDVDTTQIAPSIEP